MPLALCLVDCRPESHATGLLSHVLSCASHTALWHWLTTVPWFGFRVRFETIRGCHGTADECHGSVLRAVNEWCGTVGEWHGTAYRTGEWHEHTSHNTVQFLLLLSHPKKPNIYSSNQPGNCHFLNDSPLKRKKKNLHKDATTNMPNWHYCILCNNCLGKTNFTSKSKVECAHLYWISKNFCSENRASPSNPTFMTCPWYCMPFKYSVKHN